MNNKKEYPVDGLTPLSFLCLTQEGSVMIDLAMIPKTWGKGGLKKAIAIAKQLDIYLNDTSANTDNSDK